MKEFLYRRSALFSVADKRRLSSGLHSPLFAVVMKSPNIAKQLECHGFICHSPEDAIVIAATLYQSLMAYMGSNSQVSCAALSLSQTRIQLRKHGDLIKKIFFCRISEPESRKIGMALAV
jgi:hypothetical protein